jgi:hypothetical protein
LATSDELPGIGRRTDRPRLNTAVDLTRLTLSPTDGFVLSRVDGRSSYDEIILLTGLGPAATLEILRRLRAQGLILNPDETAPTLAPKPEPKPAAAAPSLLERLDDGTPVDPAVLRAGPDLDEATKLRVARLHRRIARMAPHERLGVPADADAATIKRAYFAASKELHPDRFYGRDLGPFRAQLADIFARITEAFEALRARKKSG